MDIYLSRRRTFTSRPCDRSRDFSVYRGLSAGPEAFLLFRHRCPSLFLLFSGSTRRRLGFGASIASRRSPSSLQPLPEGSDFRAPCSSDSSERIGHSAVKGNPYPLKLSPLLTVPRFFLVSFGLPMEAGFLPGIALPSLLPLWQAFTLRSSPFSQCTGWRRPFHEGSLRKSVYPARGLSFPKVFRSPRSS